MLAPSKEKLVHLAKDLADRGATVTHDEDGHTTINIPLSGRAAQDTDANASDDHLRLLIERIERLEEEKKGIADDIVDTYLEAKSVGYDVKIMRKIVALRKMPVDARREMEAILELYKNALGLV